jgi:hypothetical protein
VTTAAYKLQLVQNVSAPQLLTASRSLAVVWSTSQTHLVMQAFTVQQQSAFQPAAAGGMQQQG